jgi:outer membrane immunogenic protein
MSQVLCARAFAVAVLGTVATVAATPALSADLYGQQPPPPNQGYAGYTAQSPVANWAGAYLGVTPGYSLGGLRNRIAGSNTLKSSINGADIGIYGGVNAIVANNIVVGGEGDISLSDQRNTQTNGLDVYKAYSSWNASLRGRAGFAIDRFLPFVTAGVAFGDNTLNINGTSDSSTQVGFALGAGLESFITDRIILKGEFVYEGFGDQQHNIAGKSVGTNISTGILRIGAAYKF